MNAPGRRRVWTIGLRVLMSALILSLILLLPLDEFLQAIRSVRLEQWLAVLLFYLLRHLSSAWKWWLLLGRDSKVSFGRAVRAYYWGLFASLCIPGVAGGDVVRIGLVARYTDQRTRAVVRSVADRILDIYSLLLVSLAGALFLLGEDLGILLWLGRLFMLALPGALALLFLEPLARQLGKLPDFKAKDRLVRGFSALVEIKRRPGVLAAVILASVVGHAVFVLLNISLARASSPEISTAAWFFAWPLAKLLAVVPITIGGLGLREGALAALLLPFGSSAASVVAAGLLWESVVFGGALVSGLIALLLDTRAVRHVEPRAMPLVRTTSTGLAGADRVEILLYHSISLSPGVTSIPPETFRAHLRILSEEGYTVIDLPTLVAWHAEGAELPKRAAALTFDDGFQDFADNALPALREHGWPCTVFLCTGCIGGVETWEGANDPPRAIMRWETIRRLTDQGVHIGGHSATHRDLTRLQPAEVEAEIRGSLEAIEREVGRRPEAFAAPYGKTNALVRETIGRHSAYSMGTELAAARPTSEALDLPRIEMHYFRDLRLWRAYLRGEADFYFRFRAILRKVRQMALSIVRRPRPGRSRSATLYEPA